MGSVGSVLSAFAITLGVILLVELPDKTLIATLVLSALLTGIVGVLIHHLLSCCPRLTIKMIAKQRFQSRQYQHP